MPSVAITPGRMEILARALDRATASGVVPRLRIDELRSLFVATDAQGRSWTIDAESHRWGRLHDERWMVDDPPRQLFMGSELRASLEELEAVAARAIMTGTDALHAPRTSWFRTPSIAGEPEPSSHVAAQAAKPVEETAPSRPAIPEAHRRFAGPALAPASAELPATVPPCNARPERQGWVPTSIAPRLATVRPEPRDDRAHVLLCGLLAALFLVLGFWKSDVRSYAAALLFAVLTVTLLILNLARSRHE